MRWRGEQITVTRASNYRADDQLAGGNDISHTTQERVMKKIAVVSMALAVLATTPALARVRHHQQNQSWTSSQVDRGYYDPAKVRSGDVPFAPF
jgi:hypothetical protein